MSLAFPKPKDKPKLLTEPFKVMPDGREICYVVGTVAQSLKGRAEYRKRVSAMWERQKGVCCLYGWLDCCPGELSFSEATFEHENGRSGGRRDDRISLPNGDWINGAAHGLCNSAKGSRRIPYNRARNQSRAGSLDEVR